MKDRYALGDSAREIRRLSLQASFFEPMAETALLAGGLGPGLRCADVGCGAGHVTSLMGKIVGRSGGAVGIDQSEKYIDYCNHVNNKRNVRFVKGNIISDDLGLDGTFDVVYSRFMFVHLNDKRRAMESMVRLARKGGTVIIQELDHAADSWLSHPARDSFEVLRRCYTRIVREMGGDPLAGRKLYKLFIDASLDASVDCTSPCIRMGRGPYNVLGWRLAESLRPKILSLGLLTAREYSCLLRDLKEMSGDRNSFATYARVFTVTGKKK